MLDLERRGRLDRRVEGLPLTLAIADRRASGRGLTRPELAVITAYGKLELSADLAASEAHGRPPTSSRCWRPISPAPLKRFEAEMRRHPPAPRDRRDRARQRDRGQARPDLRHPPARHAGLRRRRAGHPAFETARRVFRLDEAWMAVDALDYQVGAEVQTALYAEIARTLRGQTYWLSQRVGGRNPGVQALIDAYRPTVDVMQQGGAELLSRFEREAAEARCRAFAAARAPQSLWRARWRRCAPSPGRWAWPTWRARSVDRRRRWRGSTARSAQPSATTACAPPQRASAPPTGYERQALRGLIVQLIEQQVARTREVASAKGAGDLDPRRRRGTLERAPPSRRRPRPPDPGGHRADPRRLDLRQAHHRRRCAAGGRIAELRILREVDGDTLALPVAVAGRLRAPGAPRPRAVALRRAPPHRPPARRSAASFSARRAASLSGLPGAAPGGRGAAGSSVMSVSPCLQRASR